MSVLTHCLASPVNLNPEHTISRRLITGYVDCDDSQKKKLGQDFADASSFADHASSMDNNQAAFTHYFRTSGRGKTDDWKMAQEMWDVIHQNNDPTNAPFKFSVRCAQASDTECQDRNSISFAITDARPQNGDTPREIKICPTFFTHDWTKQSTTSHPYKPNPTRREDSWCTPGARFRDFSVGGLVLLHEMTHLDAVGKKASYPVDHNGMHGTEDTDVGPRNDPVQQARNLAKLWQAGRQGADDPEPYRNAESLAASAFEWYVMELCKISVINN
ncbi:hypothetical protein F5B20DRAFT_586799 [Whalleya microplaca]|nr:hypothetical protein F5B20DRAFT_586799 [Whalleya microplaca]